MSGAERTNDEIANDVFHALYPECGQFPGTPNPCEPQCCDCFECEQLPEKVALLLKVAIAANAHVNAPRGKFNGTTYAKAAARTVLIQALKEAGAWTGGGT